MNIVKVSTSQILIPPYNPNAMDAGELEKLKLSIQMHDYVEPIVWNSVTGHAVGGSHRLLALKALGYTEVDVVEVRLDLNKEKALNLALNKIHGKFDEVKLSHLLDELCRIPDFNIALTGFEMPEISSLFDKHLTPDLDTPEPLKSEGPFITQRGDLIQLGDHRLLCGNSGSSDDMKTLLGDQKIQLVFCDPPYGCAYDPSNRPGGGGSSEWLPIANDGLAQEKYEPWFRGVLECLKLYLDDGAPVYFWNGHRQFGFMHSILTELGFYVSNAITWVKPFPTPGYGDYQMACEYCLYAWSLDGGAHRWFGPPDESNVWESPRDSVSTLIHPTQKPVSLAQRAIKNSSQRGDLVFDGFAGSGSTLIAAQSMERICYAVELEPSYCDSIVKRFIRTFGRESVNPEVFERYGKEASHE